MQDKTVLQFVSALSTGRFDSCPGERALVLVVGAMRAMMRLASTAEITMRKGLVVPLLVLLVATSANAAKKQTGTTKLLDVQPAGTTDTKNKKKQQFDFSFETGGHHYVCRTGPKTSVKATDFVVGSQVQYEVKGDKGKLKNTEGEDVKCTVVRVEKASAPAQ
jgi:hypothetical protein